MNRRLVTCGILIGLLAFCVSSHAETTTNGNQEDKSVTIPLDQIWAWQMPGTRDVRNLEPEPKRIRHDSLANQIAHALSRGRDKKEMAGPAFVVVGQGREALRNARRVLVKDKTPPETFRAKKALSVVFFSHSSSQYVHLKSVTTQNHRIEIRYQLVPHRTKELSVHFALVGLGKINPGEYDVEIIRNPLAQQYVQAGFKPVSQEYVRRCVCLSFSFTIGD